MPAEVISTHWRLDNPYQDTYNAVVQNDRTRYEQLDRRDDLVLRYAWAIPNTPAIREIVKHGPILEMGAGTGYWAWLIRQMGGDIIAYDAKLAFWQHKTYWTEVLTGGVSKVNRHSDRALMLCWPPYDESFATKCLKRYRGDTVIYIGESMGGCTADDEFHDLLDNEWDLTVEVDIPQWRGIHDHLWVYKQY